MEISLIVAKVLGTYLVISGFFLLLRGKTLPNILKDFFEHPAVVYLTGVILIFLSTLFLVQNNVWDGTWRSVVTLFVWLVLIKGLAYIFAPEMLHKIVSKKLLEMLNIYGIVAILAGICLFYLG